MASNWPQISYNSSITFQSATRFLEHVSASEYVELVREANLNDFDDADATYSEEDITNYQNNVPGYEGGDWINALIKNNAPMQQHSISVAGGADQVKYFTSLGYTDQESFFRSRDFDYRRYNARSNIDIKLNEVVNLTLDLSYRQDIRKRPAESALSNIWIDLATAQPIFRTALPDDVDLPEPNIPAVAYSGSTTGNRNPLARSSRSVFGTYDRYDNTFRGKLGFQYNIMGIEGLLFKGELNIQTLNRAEKTFRNPYNIYRYDPMNDEIYLEGTGNAVSAIMDEQYRRNMVYPWFLLNMKWK